MIMKLLKRLLIPILTILFALTTYSADDRTSDNFISLFDGVSLKGWVGNVEGYQAENGRLTCLPGKGKGGNIFTDKGIWQFRFPV